jgi:hypothetical protein
VKFLKTTVFRSALIIMRAKKYFSKPDFGF